ncbi:MAG TPA: glutamate-cysteine ligase family protein [Polyangiaceae bacterium]|jgi:glutamate--cysteine ligase|nr:glutamate-cysteine ligase family protein [Polyangiaceae bacterium]
MLTASKHDDRPVHRDDLERIFLEAEKPESAFRIGAEAEKFGVQRDTGAPLQYDGAFGVRRLFDSLATEHGWSPLAETDDGPPIALTRGDASITLEPGAQFELSGAPYDDVHHAVTEMHQHLTELAGISKEMGLVWLGVGFHPFAAQADLPWVPKHRYGIMREYLPTRGEGALDMMRRTATVQANFDYSNEEDAMRKLVVLLRLSPILHAMTANAPFVEGRRGPRKSERGHVWLHMDPSRSGLIESLWTKPKATYRDYAEWALDAGMFLFRRSDGFVHNTGQTFRSFMKDGYQGHHATYDDWLLHLNTLFPEARLKRTIEIRACDMLPERLTGAVPALCTGLVYDRTSLDLATELALRLDYATVMAARPALVRDGLATNIGDVPARRLAEQVFEIAEGGLRRRARRNADGHDETVHLAALKPLVAAGCCPADVLIDGLSPGTHIAPAELLERVRI